MTTNKNNKVWIVYSVLAGIYCGAILYCSMTDSFYKGAAEGFEDGRKNGFEAGRNKGLKEAHETIVSAYNGQSQASQRLAAPQ